MPNPADPYIQQRRWRVGDRVRRLRMWRNLTLEQVEDSTGITVRSLTRYENGHRAMDIDHVHLIARALQVDPVWFFGDQQLPPPLS